MDKNQGRDHAVVIGGSVAGLLAARAAASHFRKVTILERNETSDNEVARKGVPQSIHAHVLLSKGRMLIDEFFPGFTQELIAHGAVLGDWTGDAVRYLGGGFHVRKPCGSYTLMASRILVEQIIRRRLAKIPNVELRDAVHVNGLLIDSARGRVTGLQLDGVESPQILHTDLVIDASGRGSRLPAWLLEHGLTAPDEERIKVDLVYTTRWLHRTPAQVNGATSVMVNGVLRGGVALAQENDRWVVSLAAYRNSGAPTEDEGFRAFAEALPASSLISLLNDSEPIAPAVSMRFPHNQRRRYEKLRDLPKGILVCGDALCSVNPLYAQGMTVAAMEAHALFQALTADDKIEQRYFREASRIVDVPWQIVAQNDARLLGISRSTPLSKFLNYYMDCVHIAARADVRVAEAFVRVVNLMRHPSSLFTPKMMWRVLSQSMLHQRTGL